MLLFIVAFYLSEEENDNILDIISVNHTFSETSKCCVLIIHVIRITGLVKILTTNWRFMFDSQ
jgi:hypothetical protein